MIGANLKLLQYKKESFFFKAKGLLSYVDINGSYSVWSIKVFPVGLHKALSYMFDAFLNTLPCLLFNEK